MPERLGQSRSSRGREPRAASVPVLATAQEEDQEQEEVVTTPEVEQLETVAVVVAQPVRQPVSGAQESEQDALSGPVWEPARCWPTELPTRGVASGPQQGVQSSPIHRRDQRRS